MNNNDCFIHFQSSNSYLSGNHCCKISGDVDIEHMSTDLLQCHVFPQCHYTNHCVHNDHLLNGQMIGHQTAQMAASKLTNTTSSTWVMRTLFTGICNHWTICTGSSTKMIFLRCEIYKSNTLVKCDMSRVNQSFWYFHVYLCKQNVPYRIKIPPNITNDNSYNVQVSIYNCTLPASMSSTQPTAAAFLSHLKTPLCCPC